MEQTSRHAAKRRIYEQFARVSKALASPARLELVDLLIQSERSVNELAAATELSIANASQHLQVLAAARLVATSRRGQRVVYRVADESVEALWHAVRRAAEARLADLADAARDYLTGSDDLESIDRAELMRRLRAGTVTLIDVRPSEEYAQAHLPGAISVPIERLATFVKSAPRRGLVVAYCRGPYCVYAVRAVAALHKRGIRAMRLEDGVSEWRAAGLTTERSAA
ncbi:MAG TPA: metalloregulator ArsR/SmtB family transcription factor [Kofleriaceae bacterium]|nr:metalloregulator ArsR/SmtB family transcription factor [Kofleriaceae bacterium]